MERCNLYFIDDKPTTRRRLMGALPPLPATAAALTTGEGVTALAAGMAPNALAFDAAGQLYFTAFVNARLRVIRADGKTCTVAGTDTAGHAGDGGPAARAQLFQPFALAFDAAGSLYVYRTPCALSGSMSRHPDARGRRSVPLFHHRVPG
jgi:hypothetical protein